MSTFRAAEYDHTGAPDVLHLVDVETTDPQPHHVAVRVRAAGVNPFDAKVRAGHIPMKTPFPRRIGSDLAGTVEAVSEGAQYWDGTPIAVGDEVLGSGVGSIAERSFSLASNLTRRPDAVPVEVAAGMHVPALTAVSCLVTVPVDSSDTLLVGGASGAVGLVVTQLAAAAGARVIGTASAANADFIQSLGGEPVTYGPGLADRVKAMGTITAVIDCHGREALDAGVALGVPANRMVAIAAHDAQAELGLNPVDYDARTAKNLAGLADKIAAGTLVFPVAQSFSLDDVVAAFTAVEGAHAPGKIIITN